jgi:hypothetical protein
MPSELASERVEFTVDLLLSTPDSSLPTQVAEFLAEQQGVSFQDMKSIARQFKRHLDYEPPRDSHTNNIALAQHCRHAIVHSGGVVDRRVFRSIRDLTPRTIKQSIELDDRLQFLPSEITEVSESMMAYLVRTSGAVLSILTAEPTRQAEGLPYIGDSRDVRA